MVGLCRCPCALGFQHYNRRSYNILCSAPKTNHSSRRQGPGTSLLQVSCRPRMQLLTSYVVRMYVSRLVSAQPPLTRTPGSVLYRLPLLLPLLLLPCLPHRLGVP